MDPVQLSWQRMQECIEDFEKRSGFVRTRISDTQDAIWHSGGREIIVTRITNPDDPRVETIHRVLTENFPTVDLLSRLRYDVMDERETHYCAEDADGNFIGLLVSSCLRPSTLANQTFIFIDYIVTNPLYRDKGIALALYSILYSMALRRAKMKGERLGGIVGEVGNSVERFRNKLGSRRLYFKDQFGNVREVEYKCPPIRYDCATGEALTEAYAEHLMVHFLDGRIKCGIDEVVGIVDSMHNLYKLGAEFFVVDDVSYPSSMLRQHQLIDQHIQAFRSSLDRAEDGEIFLLSADEREVMKKDIADQCLTLVELET